MSLKNCTHLDFYSAEPRDWKRTHLRTGHVSFVTRSTALHRLYFAKPELSPLEAHCVMDAGTFETDYAIYERGKA